MWRILYCYSKFLGLFCSVSISSFFLFFKKTNIVHTFLYNELARLGMGTNIVVGERAKQARHSQVCSIENRGYIYIYTSKMVHIVRRVSELIP